MDTPFALNLEEIRCATSSGLAPAAVRMAVNPRSITWEGIVRRYGATCCVVVEVAPRSSLTDRRTV